MTGEEWMTQVCRTIGPLPTDYLVIDIETSGLKIDEDIPVQLGWVLVADGRNFNSGHQLLDWSETVDRYWLARRMKYARQQVEFTREGLPTGQRYAFSLERLINYGRPALEVLGEFFRLYDQCTADGMAVVCHNGLSLDLAMLNRARQHFFSTPLRAERYVDTMALERALQIDRLPVAGDSWRSFCERVYRAGGSKIKSSLLHHCRPKYKLGSTLTQDLGHEADYDAVLTHELIEVYRNMCPDELKGLTCQTQPTQ